MNSGKKCRTKLMCNTKGMAERVNEIAAFESTD